MVSKGGNTKWLKIKINLRKIVENIVRKENNAKSLATSYKNKPIQIKLKNRKCFYCLYIKGIIKCYWYNFLSFQEKFPPFKMAIFLFISFNSISFHHILFCCFCFCYNYFPFSRTIKEDISFYQLPFSCYYRIFLVYKHN